MNSKKIVGQIGPLAVALLIVTLAGCGGVEGNYACKDGVLSSVQLKSGGKAYVTMGIFGQEIEKGGTYTVDDDKVNVVIDGESMLFTASGNTLNGGEMFGKCTT
jgi:hypothetical protein